MTDTIFSMDGDLAPLPALRALCDDRGAVLVVDDAHATGVYDRATRADVVIGTLSKALGSTGGFVCADRDTIALMRSSSRAFMFDTAPPAAAIGAALEALDVLAAEPERAAVLRARTVQLRVGLIELGLTVLGDEATPIVPVLIGSEARAAALAAALEAHGVLAPAIRPPTVPAGAARIRLTAMATHTEAHIDRVLVAFAAAIA